MTTASSTAPHDVHPHAPGGDLPRLLAVTLSAVVCIVGGAWGSGAFGGTPVAEAAGGALSAESTLIAPDGPAFSIWSVIYLGLVAYTVWQWLPGQRGDGANAARHRAVGWWVAASMLLNFAWLATVQAGWVAFSVVVIVALALVLGMAARALQVRAADGWADRVVTDGTVGLYLGWVTVATCANAAAALVDGGFDPGAGKWWALAVLVVAGLLALLLTRAAGGNVAVALAVAWGLGWVAVGRLDGEPSSTFVGASAAAVSGVVLVGGVLLAVRSGAQAQRAARDAG